MAQAQLIFDRVAATSVRRLMSCRDNTLFVVKVRNAGEGPPDSAEVRAEATGSAQALLTGDDQPDDALDDWIVRNVLRTANSLPNDGQKITTLAAKAPLVYDSRYVLD